LEKALLSQASQSSPSAEGRPEEDFKNPEWAGLPLSGGPAGQEKQMVVVDGQNVASHHNPFNNGYQNVQAIEIVVEFWLRRGHPCIALVPSLWLRKEGGATDSEKLEQLKELLSRRIVGMIPEDDNDQEPYIVQYAQANHCVVVTMDMFAPAIRRKKTEEERESMRAWVRRATVPYTFVADDYVPDSDFIMPGKLDLWPSGMQGWSSGGNNSTGGTAVGGPGFLSPRGSSSPGTKGNCDEESPSVAVFRRRQVQHIMTQICDLNNSSNSRYTFLTRKVAADVFNKWVFQMNATGHSNRDSTRDVEDNGWSLSGSALDPVIP